MKYVLIMAFFLFALPVKATEIARIPEGITSFDIDSDGTKEIIIKAWHSNFNAHGFYVISVYKSLGKRFLIIPNQQNSTFKTRHTADCALKDYYALRENGRVSIIEVQVKNHKTRFTKYGMFENKEATPGGAPWYFEPFFALTKSKKYCDLFKAIEDNKHHL